MDEFLCSIPFIIKSSYSSTQLLDNLAKIRLLYDSYKVFEYFFLLFDEICERLKWKECFVFDYFQIKYQD